MTTRERRDMAAIIIFNEIGDILTGDEMADFGVYHLIEQLKNESVVTVVRHATTEIMFECDTVEQAEAWINGRAKTDATVERGEYVIDVPEVTA